MALTAIWVAAGPNSAAEITGDARYYLALWKDPREPTAPPYTYRVLTPWLARLLGLDAFWAFAVVTVVGLAAAAVLLWAVVLRDRPPPQAWLALGLFVVSPAAVYSLADHYLVDALAYAALAGVLLALQRTGSRWRRSSASSACSRRNRSCSPRRSSYSSPCGRPRGPPADAALTLGATAAASIGVQKMPRAGCRSPRAPPSSRSTRP